MLKILLSHLFFPLLRGEQDELVPSLDDNRLPEEGREVLVHRRIAPTIVGLHSVEVFLNEVVEVVVAVQQLVSLERVVPQEL